ncbi:hypothetical protein BBO99_00005534 [Phytophthora kernoviae]|uniref:Serine-threonine/tyrosine-protein kinase catalytic domain-containing protein n=2 Tax=Phytophthora kernoviae TaxID=325452 RepID=A0A3R7J704_9STRA|nr:hypothetical protein G195_006254 [Phytophthora kernoviae 00238/432]KAG2525445.1 hypothetical protein JM16_004411 [Phytophthora kernoviae]KAG2526799.1 hypothetical protein JM18_004153 [Phytophthora kernoviae]RLN13784.1 hypothetical protein BBI17_005160 [Phytophthora kernoviae]RLN79061.1 hypothetical protein BBO99_00005534 [Phytophthora kernoviae]
MGFCLSKCLPDSDMAAELEAELDDTTHSYVQASTEQSAFGTTSLLAADEVLTTGELPYLDMHSNAEISEYVLSGCRPIMKPGQCNIKWAELMARCWSHNPARRPSAAEIVSSLESISKADAIAQSAKKETRVVNSNRADYRFAEKPRTRSKGSSKFKSNVRVVV